MTSHSFYGQQTQHTVTSEAEALAEAVRLCGYAVIPSVVDGSALSHYRDAIDRIYAQQEAAFGGGAALEAIQERDMCRAPLLYERDFLGLATHPRVLSAVRLLLGEWAILSLQNAIICRPGVPHHQSTWHRDLPHASFTTSQPIGVNAMLAVDDFTLQSGATQLLPYSHQSVSLPSASYIDTHAIGAECESGSVILFNAMLFHRAGANRAPFVRRGVNHLYTISMIKQQYDFPRALGDPTAFNEDERRLLGYPSAVPLDDVAWRTARAQRLQKASAA